MPVIGWLNSVSQRRNVTFESAWADGQYDRLRASGAEIPYSFTKIPVRQNNSLQDASS
jgi:hypothetical protein